jgi:polyhydroxyalkanoate synthesis repressor PhaR
LEHDKPLHSDVSDGTARADAPKRVIKRYANRKLYDTVESRYITLSQVADYVRAGEDVQIIDNATKEDLTRVTLAQIIYYEEERRGHSDDKGAHGTGSLRSLIQQGGERLVATIRDKTKQRFAVARSESSTDQAGQAESSRRNMMSYPKEIFEEVHRLVDERMRSIVGGAIAPLHQMQSEVKRLASRIEELEAKLKAVAQGGSAGGSGEDAGGPKAAQPVQKGSSE